MSSLHVYFALRNQNGFRQTLDQQLSTTAALSSSLSKSPKSWVMTGSGIPCDVNARDHLGRTVLHLACASTEPFALEFVKMLLGHSNVNVNSQDTESHWTPLHRALYLGNPHAALLLLQRTDIDVSLKDLEGYTPFDLYNSTVEGTKPSLYGPHELFSWGANRFVAQHTDTIVQHLMNT
jgi:inhibitor of Bruton tyrosine kinase